MALTITLPQLIRNDRERTICLFVGVAATLILYPLTNRYHYIEPQLLPFTWVDSVMPFWPWTVWIYVTEYIIFFVAYFRLRDSLNTTKYFYSYLFILLFSVVVFIFYPVTFPRHDFGLEGHPDNFSKWGLNVLRNHMDTPANCLPSLHVSSCYISSICFWSENRRLCLWMLAWSTLVAISTLTTKQHYLVDIIAALILTAAAYWFFFYKARYR